MSTGEDAGLQQQEAASGDSEPAEPVLMWRHGVSDRLCLLLVCRGATLAGGDGAAAGPAGADGAGEGLPAGQGEGRAGQLPGPGEPPVTHTQLQLTQVG